MEGPLYVTSPGQQHHFLKGAEPEMGHCLVSLCGLCALNSLAHTVKSQQFQSQMQSQPILLTGLKTHCSIWPK